ncbi:hypothetical protein Tco_1503220 [Tanacetum coccineum]
MWTIILSSFENYCLQKLLQEKQISEKEKAAKMMLIHDCESIHNRLFECHIAILLVESHFLLQDDKQEVSAMTNINKAENCGTAVDYELKNVLSKILTLRKIVNSVVHYALKVSSSTGKDDAEIFAEN